MTEHLPQQDVYPDDPRLDVAPFIPQDARSALDIGCGKGGFGATLRRVLGPEARIVGVEANADQAAVAAEGHGFDEVLNGYFPEALAGRHEVYDAVFFNDVLEHVLDPWGLLGRVHEILETDGRVIAAIPSIQYAPVVRELIRGRWDYADTGTLDRTHVRFFTRATMVELFEGAGFDVVECRGSTPVWNRDWSRRSWKRRLWLKLNPDAAWLHFIVVGRSTTGSRPPGGPGD